MALRVFGDSHAVNGFGRIAEVDLHWRTSLTMHRVARDGLDFLLEGVAIERGDIIMLVFGEVDARSHLCRLAKATGKGLAALVKDLASRYVTAIERASARLPGVTFVLTSVIPPAHRLAATGNAKFPVNGTLRQRIRATRLLNRALEENAQRSGLSFFEYGSLYASAWGALRRGLSDSSVHIGADNAEPVMRRLSDFLARKLTFLPKEKAHGSLRIKQLTLGRLVLRNARRQLRAFLKPRRDLNMRMRPRA